MLGDVRSQYFESHSVVPSPGINKSYNLRFPQPDIFGNPHRSAADELNK